MARERGFLIEVTAFLPAGETDVAAMSDAATRLQTLTEWLHGQGFSAVAVTSKFTSRKVDEPVPTPMQDLDDSKFPTNSGTPGLSLGRTEKQNADILNSGFASMQGRLTAEEEAELDVPADLSRVKAPGA